MNKDIFEYELSSKKKYGDPVLLSKRLFKALGNDDLGLIVKNAFLQAPEGEELSLPARALRSHNDDRLTELAYACFNVKPLDEDTGEGCTQGEVLKTLFLYMNFMDTLKKSTETSPSLPEPTQDTSVSSAETA